MSSEWQGQPRLASRFGSLGFDPPSDSPTVIGPPVGTGSEASAGRAGELCARPASKKRQTAMRAWRRLVLRPTPCPTNRFAGIARPFLTPRRRKAGDERGLTYRLRGSSVYTDLPGTL